MSSQVTTDADLLLRAAIVEIHAAAAEHGWDDQTTAFALGQMYAGTVKGLPDVEAIWQELAPRPADQDTSVSDLLARARYAIEHGNGDALHRELADALESAPSGDRPTQS